MSSKRDLAMELLRDKDVRKGVSTVVSDTYSVGKTILKVLGWTALAGVAIWGGVKIYGAVNKKLEQNKEEKEMQDRVDKNKAYIINSEDWFKSAVSTLKAAMEVSKGYNNKYTNYKDSSYDKTRIMTVLNALNNNYEWDNLIIKFGRPEGHDLKEWIGLDDKTDVTSYNQVLKTKGVENELELIPNVELTW